MECTEAIRKLLDAAEGGLPQPERRLLMEHLSRCGQCSAALGELQRASVALRLAVSELAPRQPYLTTARLNRLTDAYVGGPRPIKIITFRRFVGAAAAAVILVSSFFIAVEVKRIWQEEPEEPLLVLDWLGVAIEQEPDEREGVQVKAVLEDSPAHAAGIQVGDVLLQVGRHTVDGPSVLARYMVQTAPGRTVELAVLRDDRRRTVPVEVGRRPLLISADPRRTGEGVVRLRWRRTVSAFTTAAPAPPGRDALEEVLEENRRLRQRVQQLELRLSDLEQHED